MSTRHTGAPVYEEARWSDTQPAVLQNVPRGPEVGDVECIDLVPVEQEELDTYKFIYLPCGHWYRARNLEAMYANRGTCSQCRECYLPSQVKWVPPRVHNPAAAFLASNQLNEWVQSRMGPPWHVFQSRFVDLLSQCPGSSVERGNVFHEYMVGENRMRLDGHIKVTLWNGTSVLICPSLIHIQNSDLMYLVRNIRDLPSSQIMSVSRSISRVNPNSRVGGLVLFKIHGIEASMIVSFAVMLQTLVLPRIRAFGDVFGPLCLFLSLRMQIPLFQLDEVRNDEHLQAMDALLQQFFIMLQTQ